MCSGASPWLRDLLMRAPVAWKFRWCRIPGTKKAKNNGARNDEIAAAKLKIDGEEGEQRSKGSVSVNQQFGLEKPMHPGPTSGGYIFSGTRTLQ